MSDVIGCILILASLIGVIYFGCSLIVEIRKRKRLKDASKKDEKK